MSNVTEVVKELSLDLSGIPKSKRKEAKDEVRDYLLNEVLRSVERGVSPVEGEGRFRILTDDYAKNEKGGVRTANMELEGDLLNDLKTKNLRGDKIEIGVRGENAPKADGHNQISGEAKLWASQTGRTKYKRRFIPDESQGFTAKINKGIKSILDEFRLEEAEEVGTITDTATTLEGDSVGVSRFFQDDFIEALLRDALRARGDL